MDEKILIESKRFKLKIFIIILLTLSILCSCVWGALKYKSFLNTYQSAEAISNSHKQRGYCKIDRLYLGDEYRDIKFTYCYSCEFISKNPSEKAFASSKLINNYYTWLAIPLISAVVIYLIALLITQTSKLVVTDKSVYGKKSIIGKINIPMDSISSISTIRLFSGISIGSSSGKARIFFVRNYNEIAEKINELILKRSEATISSETNKSPSAIQDIDETDKLLKYKHLLDNGVITQEEFNAKKKELLGL